MIAITPIEKVAAMLAAAQFKRIETPFNLAGIQFDIPAAFIGTGTSSDLILLVDTATQNTKRIQHQVEGVARALDSLQSMRSLTTVVTGPRPSSAFVDSVSRVSRVLPMGVSVDSQQDADIRNWLAVLLPLELPEPEDVGDDAILEFEKSENADDVKMSLILASALGSYEVEKQLKKLISEPLDKLNSEVEI